MLDLVIKPDGTVPLSLQVREQFRWMIATGRLAPGDLLPSVRDLSESIGVGRNTVNAVYDELREQGLIRMGRGRGTEVAQSESVRQLARLAPLLEILDQAFDSALEQGFSPAEISTAAQVKAHVLEQRGSMQGAISFVERADADPEFYMRQIRELTGRPVRFIDLEQVRAKPVTGDTLVTTCISAKEVRQAVPPDTEMIILGVRIYMRDILQILQMPAGSRAVIVGRTEGSVRWLYDEVMKAGAEHLQVRTVGLDDPGAAEAIRGADRVFAFPSAYDEAVAIAGDPDRVTAMQVTLESGSALTLKAYSERCEMAAAKG